MVMTHAQSPDSTAARTAPDTYAPSVAKLAPILVAAIDAEAPEVLETARVLLGDQQREVVALSVAWPFSSEITIGELSVYPTEYKTRLLDDVRMMLGTVVGDVAPHDPRWRARAEFGEPDQVIARVAREEQASLIVMGIGQHQLVDRLFGTETALRVIELAPCAVLAVAAGLRARPRTIVVATDFSTDCMRAVECATPLLAPDSTLHFVHAWMPADGDSERAVHHNADYRASLPERFARMVDWLRLPPTMTATCEVREGRTASRLLDYAAAHSADLLVVGRHGLGKLGRLLVGSVTSVLVRGAHCSVLIAPQESRSHM
jgi:nucleotide-binding universal stress UspA family protein